MGTWACVCSTAPRMCPAVCRSSINICWLLNLKSPEPWFPPPFSDHVPSSEVPSQVASPNWGGNTFAGIGQTWNSIHGLEKQQQGLQEGPGEQGQQGKTEFAVWVIKRNSWWEALTFLPELFFSPRPLLLSLFPPSLFCSHMTSESQSITNLIPGTTIPSVEAGQSWNTPTSEFPPIPQLHTFQTPIYISSTSVLFKEMPSSALLNKQ